MIAIIIKNYLSGKKKMYFLQKKENKVDCSTRNNPASTLPQFDKRLRDNDMARQFDGLIVRYL
jgi:hypothetical protein